MMSVLGLVQIRVTGKLGTGLDFDFDICSFVQAKVEIRTCTQFAVLPRNARI